MFPNRYLIVGLTVCAMTQASLPPQSELRELIASKQFAQATAFIRSDYERFVQELITLTEIPAPPFKEARRAAAFLDMLRQQGLTDVEIDAEGNATGIRPGAGGRGGPLVAVVAHLDTVFPEGTDVTVRREGTRLFAPGVGDDTRGLAVMLALIRAIDAGQFQVESDILFVGSVGEEGEGDLRGVKFLLNKGRYRDRISHFIAIDGGGEGTITIGGVGSRRYRVVFRGPGGHSYGAFGLVNPVFALAAAAAEFSKLQVPSSPKTTYSIGILRGGTSVNSIPAEVSMDIDMRSVSCDELDKIDKELHAILREAVASENKSRSTREGEVTVDPQLIGDRPCGETPRNSPLVLAASDAIAAFGLEPTYRVSSTDANVPMSLGIPAVTIGRGPGGRGHSPDEWTDVEMESAVRSIRLAVAIVLAAAALNQGQ